MKFDKNWIEVRFKNRFKGNLNLEFKQKDEGFSTNLLPAFDDLERLFFKSEHEEFLKDSKISLKNIFKNLQQSRENLSKLQNNF